MLKWYRKWSYFVRSLTTRAGAWSLAWALPDAKSLRYLDIFECDITDDGATELHESLLAVMVSMVPRVQVAHLRMERIA